MDTLLPSKKADVRVNAIIKLAIIAVGGQGGGVLTSWIESLARSQGYICQATSVAGVAQRTGATIYYIEMAQDTGKQPVFALAPSGGDVDILIASEMMEVGRAIMRGFVTPDRTTLIGSTHRTLAVSEKMVPGDGIADSEEVKAAAEIAAQHLILADMDHLAVSQGSVISASLFGALAGSGALPFEREAFEDAIRRGGKGVKPSLRAFAAGYDVVENGMPASVEKLKSANQSVRGPKTLLTKWERLQSRISRLPDPIQDMAQAGLEKVVAFQDCAYGEGYLNHLDKIVIRDNADQDWLLSVEAAKYIANAMAYDDVIRVADLKTRAPRMDRIHDEMGTKADQLMQITEFMHPRAEEIAGMLPAGLGAKIENSPKWMARLDRLFNKGRRMRTDRLSTFILMNFLGSMKRYRLKTRRHEVEVAHLNTWLEAALAPLAQDYLLSVELLRCRRLIKGYGDTHSRGLSKFDRVTGAVHILQGREDAAEWISRLREAALKDTDGNTLDGALKTVESFA